MSPIGKIARLPKVVRDELNERLLDGEPGNLLVEWLNGREEVRAVLAETRDQRPETKDRQHEHEGKQAKGRNPWITEQNLSEWRKGGFEDWLREQESQELAGRLVEETKAIHELTGDRGLLDRAADMAALALAELLMAARRMEDGAEKRRAILKIVRELVRLRKTEREHERAQREAAQDRRSQEIHQVWVDNARRRAKPVEPATVRKWWPPDQEELDEIESEMVQRKAGAGATGSPQAATHGAPNAGGADDEWDESDPPSPGLRRAGGARTLTGEEMGGHGNPGGSKSQPHRPEAIQANPSESE